MGQSQSNTVDSNYEKLLTKAKTTPLLDSD